MDRKDFINQLRRYQKGSISRRHFLGVTGLGTATAVLAASMPHLLTSRRAYAAGDLGDQVNLTTWPDYHEVTNFEKFTAETGVKVNITVFGSNEEMFAKLKAGGTGWDVLVPTNYTIETYVGEDMFEPLDTAHAAELRPEVLHRCALHRGGNRRRQDLCRAQGLGHHRLRHQLRQGHREADQLEGVLGPDQRRAQGPHHGA